MNILSKRSNKVVKELVKERGGRVQTRVEALFITMYARTKTGTKESKLTLESEISLLRSSYFVFLCPS